MSKADQQLGIGRAAELLGISASYVRTLADRGILTSTTTPGGHRRFDRRVLQSEWASFRRTTRTPLGGHRRGSTRRRSCHGHRFR